MLNKERLRPASKGDPSLLVCTIPAALSATENDLDVFALPLDFRSGGMLIAVPHDTFRPHIIADGQLGSDETMVGPNSVFTAPLIEESEDLTTTVALGYDAQVLVVDVTDDILLSAREYDPVTDHMANILGFSFDHPTSLPDCSHLMPNVREWIVSRSEDVLGFYTAQEDLPTDPKAPVTARTSPAKKATQAKRITNNMIADQLTALAAQMQLLAQRQEALEKGAASSAANAPGLFVGPTNKLPPVSGGLQAAGLTSTTGVAKALALVGPPPKVRNVSPLPGATDAIADEPYDALQPEGEASGGIVAAIAQQSTAITQLVAHLASQSGDVLGDFATGSQTHGTTKGVQRREKMQNDLAQGTSTYFLQMLQQLHRRLQPSKPVPQAETDLQGISVLTYLERQGGYRSHRELGLVAWILGHAVDAASSGDFRMTKEILALLLVAVEQAVTDKGDWTLAFLLTLLEEPPLQVFQERSTNVVHHSKPFGPLVPPQWTAVVLSYLKDLEVLATRKTETAKKAGKPSPAAPMPVSPEPEGESSPRRKPRFPKKPKAKAPEA